MAASEAKSGSPDTVAWLRRAAELREHLAQSDEAIKDWQALLAEAPQDRQALDALGKLYEQTKNAKQFAEVVLRKAQLASDPVERRGLLLKAGEALEAAGDDARAIDACKEALALRRGRRRAARRWTASTPAPGASRSRPTCWRSSPASTTGEIQKAHLLRRAQLLEREKELPAAVEGYARLLAVAPTDPNAIAGLERLLELPAVRPDAARLLEPVYRSLNDVRHLVEVLELRLAGATPNDRVPLLEEIANLRESLGQRDLAFAARVRAFGETPESAEAREQLERLAAETGAFEELAAAYQDQLERGVTNATSTELWRRLAVLWGERLERLDLAVRAYEELARREPKNMVVLEGLARIHTRTADAKELASVMKRMVMAEQSPPKQIDLLFRARHPGRGDAGRQGARRPVLRGGAGPEARRRERDQAPGQGAHRERALARAGLADRPGDPAGGGRRPPGRDVRPDGPPRPAEAEPAGGTPAGRWTSSRTSCAESRATPGRSVPWRRWPEATVPSAARPPRRWSRSSPPEAITSAWCRCWSRVPPPNRWPRNAPRCSGRWPSSTPGRCRTPSWPSSPPAGRSGSSPTRRPRSPWR